MQAKVTLIWHTNDFKRKTVKWKLQ